MKKYLFILFFLVVVFFISGIFLPRDPFSQGQLIFQVEKGEGSKDIALNLEKEGLIFWGPLFRPYVLAKGVSGSLQAGHYQLSPAMNIPQIVEKMVRGEVIKEKMTIIEGWNLKEIALYLEGKGVAGAKELLEKEDLEGYLFPDTYWLRKDESLEEVIQKMRDNFEEKTENLEITPDIVIMASLLERELQTKEDKEIASGILWKRLEIGMPLQVDADMWTYENAGLPLKPICNPGLESILAAISPKESPFWYYLSTPEGETIFSKTLEEHNIAKAQYLK